jgi:predicted nucleic acid-binding protein
MIVGVESNFILELAFLRAEHDTCTRLLDLAADGDIRLVLPAFSLGETYESWVRRSKQGRELYNRLRTELGELSCSYPYEETPAEFAKVTGLLIRSSEEEKRRLDETLDRILDIAEVIPIGLGALRSAIVYQQSRALSPQDSIVYASILQHLAQSAGEVACFVTKNSKDFDNPDIENELRTYNCRLLMQFSDAVGYVHSRLSRSE